MMNPPKKTCYTPQIQKKTSTGNKILRSVKVLDAEFPCHLLALFVVVGVVVVGVVVGVIGGCSSYQKYLQHQLGPSRITLARICCVH